MSVAFPSMPTLHATRRPVIGRHRSILLGGVALFIVGVVVVYVSGYAADAGFQIPSDDVSGDYLIGALWAIALGMLIAAWPVVPEDKENLLLAWLAKCYVTLFFMLPYESHYELDCFGYWYRMRLIDWVWDWGSRVRGSLFVILVGWIQERFIDSFHAVKVTFAMIGLLAIFLIYRGAMAVIGRRHSNALLYVALFPSILFWSSILGKDPIVFFGVAIYVYGVAKWRSTAKVRFLIVMSAGIALAVFMRIWLGVILGLPLLFFVIRGVRGLLPRVVSSIVSLLLVLTVLSQFAIDMGVDSAEDLVAATDRVAHQFDTTTGATGSTREIDTTFTSIPMMMAFTPLGLFTVLYRPLPGEIRNIFGLLSGLENAALFFFSFKAVQSLVRSRAVRKPLLREPVVIWAVLLVITWASIYGFISFQNLGASVRFRLPIIAVVVALLLSVRWVESNVGSASTASQAPWSPRVTKPSPA